VIMEHNKRKPLVAALMSILTPGVGQIYNGQVYKSVLMCAIFWVSIIGASSIDIFSKFYIVELLHVLTIATFFYVIIDAFRVASKLEAYSLKNYNRWYVYMILILLHFCIAEILIPPIFKDRTHEVYKLSSSTMAPNLSTGDRFIVDTRNKEKKKYQRGDIVVFDDLKRSVNVLIARVIGLPGEKIEIRNKDVFINDQYLREPYKKHVDSTIFPAHISSRDNMQPLIIPKDCLFLMGDNRDRSNDSRFNNCVDLKYIHGKVTYIYWASDERKIGEISKITY
jgi:signal peptidase I